MINGMRHVWFKVSLTARWEFWGTYGTAVKAEKAAIACRETCTANPYEVIITEDKIIAKVVPQHAWTVEYNK